MSARLAAVRALVRLETDRAFVGLAERDADADADTARAATDLTAGVTRHLRWLDFLISPLVNGGLERLDAPVRAALRLGAYEIAVAGTKPHAAVAEAVGAARTLAGRGAAGLVNAVLRRLAALEGHYPAPATGDAAEDLALRYSHPTWLVRRWLGRFGVGGTEALLRHDNARPTYGLRTNPLRTTPEALRSRLDELGVPYESSPYLPDFVRLPALQAILRAGLVREGRAYVQDEAAGLVVRVLDPQPDETGFDVAAAPGGKTLYAGALMQNRGRIVASDAHAGRLRLLERALPAAGLTIVETLAEDIETRAASGATADAVLLDAPCSGTGVLAKRADLRWQRTEADLAELGALQTRLLDAAAVLVRSGGRLVYSTCSIEPEENGAQVEGFLARHADFGLEPVGERVPDAMRTPEGYYAALPHVHSTDGAFAALLVRT
ncbi:MAG TPA: 16S rRNA (cytosine(967)-C(5))-methyltransferase RsmB [Rhodothermales bacterium]|nr:16S rRNA (cytosine(967)-C(5))-methyltransferase RsmB [Rhodothermales bacterium]